MIWQETLGNGVPRRAPTLTLLASLVEATTTTVPPTTRAFVATAVPPTVATATVRVGPLYICNPERLSAMQL